MALLLMLFGRSQAASGRAGHVDEHDRQLRLVPPARPAAFADNDLTVEVLRSLRRSRSTVGRGSEQTAAVTNLMLAKLQDTIESYEKARHGLNANIGEVREASEAVSRTSVDLNDAAKPIRRRIHPDRPDDQPGCVGAGEQARPPPTPRCAIELSAIIDQVATAPRRPP